MFHMSDVQLRQRRGSGLGALLGLFPPCLLFLLLFMTLCWAAWKFERGFLEQRNPQSQINKKTKQLLLYSAVFRRNSECDISQVSQGEPRVKMQYLKFIPHMHHKNCGLGIKKIEMWNRSWMSLGGNKSKQSGI